MRMAGGDEAEFTRGRAVQQPRGQHALIDDRELLHCDAFGIEWLRAQAAYAQRIVDNANGIAEQLLAEPVLQKTGLARDRGAVRGSDQMTNQRIRDPRVVHHRYLAGRDLARTEPRHRALPRL